MFPFESDALVVQDREDLIAVLRIRFGDLPADIIEQIYEINEYSTLQRLILAAANASDWNVFLDELRAGEDSIRIVGERFNPLGQIQQTQQGKGGSDGEEEK